MLAPSTMLIRILLIADHAIVRSGLRLLIESHPGLKVVGEAGSRLDALTTANREHPDIILLDVTLPGTSGIDLLPELRASSRKAHVLILTDSHDLEEHARAVHYGAMGVVLKAAAPEVLIKAIRKVHQGEIWLAAGVGGKVAVRVCSSSVSFQSGFDDSGGRTKG